MKKIGILLLMVVVLVALTGCASKTAETPSGDTPKATEVAEVQMDEMLMQKLIDTIGTDLMKRCKDANFQLNTQFRHYDYAPYDGWEPGEDDYTDDLLFITVEVYAPKTPGEIADSDLMRELQYAIIDSNIFELTEDGQNALKGISYSKDNREDRIRLNDEPVELHFLEFDAKAVLTVGNYDNGLKNNAHREDWYRTYKWEELFQ